MENMAIFYFNNIYLSFVIFTLGFVCHKHTHMLSVSIHILLLLLLFVFCVYTVAAHS